jgi:hypothetical protein
VDKFFAKRAPGALDAEVLRTANVAVEAGCEAGGDAVLRLDQVPGTPATNVALARTTATATDLTTSASLGADFDLVGASPSAAGTVTLSTTSGAVVTIVYAAQAAPAYAGENVCSLRGTVTSG